MYAFANTFPHVGKDLDILKIFLFTYTFQVYLHTKATFGFIGASPFTHCFYCTGCVILNTLGEAIPINVVAP